MSNTETTAVMGKAFDLSDLEKGKIISYWVRTPALPKQWNLCNVLMRQWWKCYEWTKETVLTTWHANFGTPCTTDSRSKHQLPQLVCKDRRTTMVVQMNSGLLDASPTWQCSKLLRMGLKSRCLVDCSHADGWSSQPSSVCTAVLTLDPCQLEMGCLLRWIMFPVLPHGQTFAYQARNLRDQKPCNKCWQNKTSDCSVMAWGMFFLALPGSTDAFGRALSIAMVLFGQHIQVHPYMLTMFPECDGIFLAFHVMECHTNWIFHACVEEHKDFQLLPWSPNPPNFNPTEHLWDHLDQHTRQMDPPPQTLWELGMHFSLHHCRYP